MQWSNSSRVINSSLTNCCFLKRHICGVMKKRYCCSAAMPVEIPLLCLSLSSSLLFFLFFFSFHGKLDLGKAFPLSSSSSLHIRVSWVGRSWVLPSGTPRRLVNFWSLEVVNRLLHAFEWIWHLRFFFFCSVLFFEEINVQFIK